MAKDDKITNPLYVIPLDKIVIAMLKHPKMTNKQLVEAARKRRKKK